MAGTDDEKRFYMTYSRTRPNELIPWVEQHNVPMLENALHRWSEATESFKHMWEYDTPHVIDAGGYNVMSKYVTLGGELDADVSKQDVADEFDNNIYPFYPWTVQEYHDWLSDYEDEIEWATVMDYACEERFDTLWEVSDRREATFDVTLDHFNRLDDSAADYQLLPVLQGTSADDYVDFYERLEDHGIPTDYVGVGTICRISSETKLVELEAEIRDRIGDGTELHGFGIKADAFKHGVGFESADSQAWAYHPTNGRAVLDDDGRLRRLRMPDNSLARTVASFKHYYSYVTRLQQGEPAVDIDTSFVAEESDEDTRSRLEAQV